MIVSRIAFAALMERIAYLESAVRAKDGLLMQFHQAGLQSYEGIAMTERARAEVMIAEAKKSDADARVIEAETAAAHQASTEQTGPSGAFGPIGVESTGDDDI